MQLLGNACRHLAGGHACVVQMWELCSSVANNVKTCLLAAPRSVNDATVIADLCCALYICGCTIATLSRVAIVQWIVQGPPKT